jgi:hypothetical protein
VKLGNLPHQIKADTESIAPLSLHEQLKQCREHLWVNASAIVSHRHQNGGNLS